MSEAQEGDRQEWRDDIGILLFGENVFFHLCYEEQLGGLSLSRYALHQALCHRIGVHAGEKSHCLHHNHQIISLVGYLLNIIPVCLAYDKATTGFFQTPLTPLQGLLFLLPIA